MKTKNGMNTSEWARWFAHLLKWLNSGKQIDDFMEENTLRMWR